MEIKEEKNPKQEKTKNKFSKNLINLIEEKYLRKDLIQNLDVSTETKKKNSLSTKTQAELKVGDLIQIGYRIPEGDKERIQFYEGLVISKKNRTLGKTFTIRRYVQSIGLEQIFLLHSPKISSLLIKQSSKIRKAKLYFIRGLSTKAIRLKLT
jgi:large subunit ribosomal protein L19